MNTSTTPSFGAQFVPTASSKRSLSFFLGVAGLGGAAGGVGRGGAGVRAGITLGVVTEAWAMAAAGGASGGGDFTAAGLTGVGACAGIGGATGAGDGAGHTGTGGFIAGGAVIGSITGLVAGVVSGASRCCSSFTFFSRSKILRVSLAF